MGFTQLQVAGGGGGVASFVAFVWWGYCTHGRRDAGAGLRHGAARVAFTLLGSVSDKRRRGPSSEVVDNTCDKCFR